MISESVMCHKFVRLCHFGDLMPRLVREEIVRCETWVGPIAKTWAWLGPQTHLDWAKRHHIGLAHFLSLALAQLFSFGSPNFTLPLICTTVYLELTHHPVSTTLKLLRPLSPAIHQYPHGSL